MNIRHATIADNSSIVTLLKSSLGEVSSSKSITYWNWKHLDNPFGTSKILLAEENSEIIGVRPFMQWHWAYNGDVYRSLRAVDTAIHPDFQGKGIFKKLTMALLEESRAEGFHFIFNTPNKQSMPGYLKMGWKNLGKIPIRIYPVAPYRWVSNKLTSWVGGSNHTIEMPQNACWDDLDSQWDDKLGSLLEIKQNTIVPVVPKGYLKWRYGQCPVQSYSYIQDENFLIVFYPKVHSFGIELRISEFWMNSNESSKTMKNLLKKVAKEYKAIFISISALPIENYESTLRNIGFLTERAIGPNMTYLALNENVPESFQEINHWMPLIGTMELF
jgi:GNAT superfamily N-acetyltransferase